MAGYTILGSYTTVQVISSTTVQDVQYFTIQTTPSGVVASIPVLEEEFLVVGAGPELQAFAEAIETIMAEANVIAGVGNQIIDDNGLLADYVTFTVQYVGTNTAPSGVTATADVPVTLLNFSEEPRDQLNVPRVQAVIDASYNALKKSAAG